MSDNHVCFSKTEYDTSALHGLKQKAEQIFEHLDTIINYGNNEDLFKIISKNIFALKGDINNVDQFPNPIITKNRSFIDIRHLVDKSGNFSSNVGYSDLNSLVKRTELNIAWLTNKEVFFNQQNLIIDAFSSWFSYGLQKSINCDLRTTTNFRIIAAIFYLGLFNNNVFVKDEDIKFYCSKKISMYCRIPPELIYDLFESSTGEWLYNLFRACYSNEYKFLLDIVANALSTASYENIEITTGIINNSLCAGAYIGSLSSNVTRIALEHPPTFTFILSCVYDISSQKNTSVGKALAGIIKRHDNSFKKFIETISTVIE